MFKGSTAPFALVFGVAALATMTVSLDACAAAGGSRSDRAAAKMKERFAAADADRDGFVDRAEAEKGMPRAAEHFDAIDANRDGKLAPDEIAAYLREMRGSRQ